MTYDPSYKLRHKPPPISRLLRWKHLPPRMVGDPDSGWRFRGANRSIWDRRCRAIYAAMMAEKRGAVALQERVGLWFWDGERYRQ